MTAKYIQQQVLLSLREDAPGCFAGVVGQHLAVLLAHSDKELVDRHGRVYGDFAAEQSFDIMGLAIV